MLPTAWPGLSPDPQTLVGKGGGQFLVERRLTLRTLGTSVPTKGQRGRLCRHQEGRSGSTWSSVPS